MNLSDIPNSNDGNLPSPDPSALPKVPDDSSSAVTTPPVSDSQLLAAPATPQVAEDTDLIEKEWVTKAKHIVDHTHGDPHVQNQEINKIKADYIKKRYNKDIKLTEGK